MNDDEEEWEKIEREDNVSQPLINDDHTITKTSSIQCTVEKQEEEPQRQEQKEEEPTRETMVIEEESSKDRHSSVPFSFVSSLWQWLEAGWIKLLNTSTMGDVSRPLPLHSRCCILIFFIIGIVICSYLVGRLTSNYLDQKDMKVLTLQPSESNALPFPVVTICDNIPNSDGMEFLDCTKWLLENDTECSNFYVQTCDTNIKTRSSPCGRKCYVLFEDEHDLSYNPVEQVRLVFSMNSAPNVSIDLINRTDATYLGGFLFIHERGFDPLKITNTNDEYVLVLPGVYHFLSTEKSIYQRDTTSDPHFETIVQTAPLIWSSNPNLTIIDLKFKTLKIDTFSYVPKYKFQDFAADLGGSIDYITTLIAIGAGVGYMLNSVSCIRRRIKRQTRRQHDKLLIDSTTTFGSSWKEYEQFPADIREEMWTKDERVERLLSRIRKHWTVVIRNHLSQKNRQIELVVPKDIYEAMLTDRALQQGLIHIIDDLKSKFPNCSWEHSTQYFAFDQPEGYVFRRSVDDWCPMSEQFVFATKYKLCKKSL